MYINPKFTKSKS